MGAKELSSHRNPSFLPGSRKEESRGAIVGVKGQGAHVHVYIGPGTQSEDIQQPEDGQTPSEG